MSKMFCVMTISLVVGGDCQDLKNQRFGISVDGDVAVVPITHSIIRAMMEYASKTTFIQDPEFLYIYAIEVITTNPSENENRMVFDQIVYKIKKTDPFLYPFSKNENEKAKLKSFKEWATLNNYDLHYNLVSQTMSANLRFLCEQKAYFIEHGQFPSFVPWTQYFNSKGIVPRNTEDAEIYKNQCLRELAKLQRAESFVPISYQERDDSAFEVLPINYLSAMNKLKLETDPVIIDQFTGLPELIKKIVCQAFPGQTTVLS